MNLDSPIYPTALRSIRYMVMENVEPGLTEFAEMVSHSLPAGQVSARAYFKSGRSPKMTKLITSNVILHF